jgi:manganese-dependent inorganic pyrophosphatase
MAALLLAALLTDSVLLKSPTTTDTDREVAGELAATLGVDPVEFGMEMFRARSQGQVFDAKRIVTADLKEYRVGDVAAGIGQVEVVDSSAIMDHADEIRTIMDGIREAKGLDLVLLMVTDVVREGSEVLAVGRTRLAERALGIELASGSAWMPGVLSRKKQVASRLVDAVG